jgi:Rieske Fe-S protein
MPHVAPDPERRSVLRVLSGVLLVALSAAAAVPSLLYLLDPVRGGRRRPGGKSEPETLPVAPLSEVPDVSQGAPPLRATVTAAEQHDAWSRNETARLGSVWLSRGLPSSDELTCLSTVCPHAGCGVDFDEARRLFVCPCHSSTFALDGTRRDGPAPRDMDRLDVEVKDGVVRCRFQRFRPATERKEPI